MEINGKFLISLDFELMWGVFDSKTLKEYEANLLGARQVIPAILNLFKTYNIRATWATVGFLFLDNLDQINQNLPDSIPKYTIQKYNVYEYILTLSNDETTNQLHFAKEIINEIQNIPNQEIGTHTFSHYYALENGPELIDFENDLRKAIEIAKKNNIEIKSIVFPRNQFNEFHIKICHEHGITSYRGNPTNFLYKPRQKSKQNLVIKVFRFIDSYINLTGYKCHKFTEPSTDNCLNIPASDFLRPYSKKLSFLEKYKIKRIKNCMTYAAKHNLMYHLWWHPHNFGINQKENLKNLNEILEHYLYLNNKYRFESITMNAYATRSK